jgi:GWxTD domain-containing protein
MPAIPAADAGSPLALSKDALRDAIECRERLVRERAPDAVQVWLEIGQLRLRLSQAGAIARPGPLQPVGSTYAEGAARAFIHALELDHACVAAAPLLWDAIQRQRYWADYDDAWRALRLTAGTPADRDAATQLIRLRLERHMAERDSARAVAARHLAVATDSGAGYYELARERYAAGETVEAERAYWAGAERAGSAEAVALYRADVVRVGSPGEQQEVDTLSARGLLSFLRRFWSRRDAEAGRPTGTRLAEHFRRIEYAEANFRVRMRGEQTSLETMMMPGGPAILADDSLIEATMAERLLGQDALVGRPDTVLADATTDPRGAMYIRHGPPDRRAGKYWLYERDGRTLMVQPVPVQDARSGTRCDLMPRYCVLEMGGSPSVETLRRWRREERLMLRTALATDGFSSTYRRELQPVVQVVGVAGAAGRGRLLGVVAVRGRELEAAVDSAGGRARYSLRLRLTALDSAGSRFEIDTLRTLVAPAAARGGEHFALLLELPVPAGVYRATLAVEQPGDEPGRPEGIDPELLPGRGAVRTLSAVEVPAPAGQALSLSELVLGRAGFGLTWWNDREAIPLSPLNAVPKGGAVELYYEAGGMVPGASYATTVTVLERDEARARPLVSVRFEERGRGAWQTFSRTIDVGSLRAGSYDLEVAITPEGGAAVRRRAVLNVVAP